MLLFLGLLMLLQQSLAVEGCNATQRSTATLNATEEFNLLEGSSVWLPFNATCQWNITAPEGRVVRISVYARSFHESCSASHVRVHDGPSGSSNLILDYCISSSIFRGYFFSSGRSLFLEAKTGISNYTAYLRVYYNAETFQDCSLNSTLDAPLSPTEHNFSSPYYPRGFPMNTTCGWYITAPENHSVKLQLAWWLGSSSSSKDSVEVYDVEESQHSIVGLRLHDRSPKTIYSKFRSLYVLFKSDDKPQAISEKGIFVYYTAISPALSCSSGNTLDENRNIRLENPSGVIKTPGYPYGYPDNLIEQCYWKIFAPKGQIVRVEFSSFRLERRDCVEIVNALNKQFPLGIRRCGANPSFVIYSISNELGIKVNSYIPYTGPGFIANYTTVPAVSSGTCLPDQNTTVNMAGEGMTFSSPGYPFHPGNGSCFWNITVSPGEFVKLTIWSIFGKCNESYVDIYDVTNSTRVSIGKFCLTYFGSTKQSVYSKGNKLLVEYVTASVPQSINSLSGFLATYETRKIAPAAYACSRAVYDSGRIQLQGKARREFASFGYPQPYANDANCSWVIEVPVGNIIQITFHSFDLQQSQDCQADYVEIKQGKYYFQASVIGRFCGSSLPPVILSNQTKVYVDFVADSSGRYPGFHASFVAVDDPAMGPCKLQGADNVIPLTGVTGRLFSPLYPQTYPPNMTCTWKITVPEGHFVKLRILAFHLGYICRGPFLEIRNGEGSSSGLLKSFCGGEFDPSVFSSGRHLWVRFQTPADQFLYGTGFNALFEAVTQVPAPFSCTGANRKIKLEAKTGTLASYNYPLLYDDKVECVWSIYVHYDYKIELSFEFFNLSESSECSEDYVEIRDGVFSSSPVIGKFCGAEKPPPVTSKDWDMRIEFRSLGKTKYPGFKASYKTILKDNTLRILKILGICFGSLFAVGLIVGGCFLYWKQQRNNRAGPAVVQGTVPVIQDTVNPVVPRADGVPQQTTKL